MDPLPCPPKDSGVLGGFWNPEHHQAEKAGISALPTPTMLPPIPRSPPLAPPAIPWQYLMGTFESPVGRKYRCESCRARESVRRAQEREGSYPNVGQAILPPCPTQQGALGLSQPPSHWKGSALCIPLTRVCPQTYVCPLTPVCVY